jgi:endonuclease/exonuclease/phosphatase family metal-dependent hydrolase
VAWLAKPAIVHSADIVQFLAHLPPVPVDDSGATRNVMGRGALAITVHTQTGQPVQLVTTHLKSKLLTYLGGRFQPHDEDERARYAAYALDHRAAEAATLRAWVTGALNTADGQRLILTGDLNDTEQADGRWLVIPLDGIRRPDCSPGGPGSPTRTSRHRSPSRPGEPADHAAAMRPRYGPLTGLRQCSPIARVHDGILRGRLGTVLE